MLEIAQENAAQEGGYRGPLQRHNTSRLRKPGNLVLVGIQLAGSFDAMTKLPHDGDELQLCDLLHERRNLMASSRRWDTDKLA